MNAGLDPTGLFANSKKQWLFVDWAPGLYAYTPEGSHRNSTSICAGIHSGCEDAQCARRHNKRSTKYSTQANKTLAAVRTICATPTNRLRQNMAAQRAGHADYRRWRTKEANAIWRCTLANQAGLSLDPVISPYFNAYILDALAKTDHDRQALDWIRQYWGGMLAEGATSFWESYDLRWPKTNPHLSLQADGTSGYFVSLAHGWSAGPTAWLSENVLAILPATPATIR